MCSFHLDLVSLFVWTTFSENNGVFPFGVVLKPLGFVNSNPTPTQLHDIYTLEDHFYKPAEFLKIFWSLLGGFWSQLGSLII